MKNKLEILYKFKNILEKFNNFYQILKNDNLIFPKIVLDFYSNQI